MNGLELNKIAASVLVAGLIAMAAGKIATGIYRPEGGHAAHGEEVKRGFAVEVAEEATGTGAAKAPEAFPDITSFLAKADASAGEASMKKCAACHSFDKGGPNKVGPNLWGVVGGAKGHRATGFAYSATLSGMSGTWGYNEIAQFLHNPKKYAPGTKMAFAGISKPEEVANVLAYLRTLSDSPLPLPK